jgi:hypothetical protein
VQVASADRSRRDANDRIRWLLDARVLDDIDTHAPWAAEHYGTHGTASSIQVTDMLASGASIVPYSLGGLLFPLLATRSDGSP